MVRRINVIIKALFNISVLHINFFKSALFACIKFALHSIQKHYCESTSASPMGKIYSNFNQECSWQNTVLRCTKYSKIYESTKNVKNLCPNACFIMRLKEHSMEHNIYLQIKQWHNLNVHIAMLRKIKACQMLTTFTSEYCWSLVSNFIKYWKLSNILYVDVQLIIPTFVVVLPYIDDV